MSHLNGFVTASSVKRDVFRPARAGECDLAEPKTCFNDVGSGFGRSRRRIDQQRCQFGMRWDKEPMGYPARVEGPSGLGCRLADYHRRAHKG